VICRDLKRWRYARERSCLLWVQPQFHGPVIGCRRRERGNPESPGHSKVPRHAKCFRRDTTHILRHLCLSSAAAGPPCEFRVEVIHGFPKILVGSLRAKCQVGNTEVTGIWYELARLVTEVGIASRIMLLSALCEWSRLLARLPGLIGRISSASPEATVSNFSCACRSRFG
jgi:hypothetical protein